MDDHLDGLSEEKTGCLNPNAAPFVPRFLLAELPQDEQSVKMSSKSSQDVVDEKQSFSQISEITESTKISSVQLSPGSNMDLGERQSNNMENGEKDKFSDEPICESKRMDNTEEMETNTGHDTNEAEVDRSRDPQEDITTLKSTNVQVVFNASDERLYDSSQIENIVLAPEHISQIKKAAQTKYELINKTYVMASTSEQHQKSDDLDDILIKTDAEISNLKTEKNDENNVQEPSDHVCTLDSPVNESEYNELNTSDEPISERQSDLKSHILHPLNEVSQQPDENKSLVPGITNQQQHNELINKHDLKPEKEDSFDVCNKEDSFAETNQVTVVCSSSNNNEDGGEQLVLTAELNDKSIDQNYKKPSDQSESSVNLIIKPVELTDTKEQHNECSEEEKLFVEQMSEVGEVKVNTNTATGETQSCSDISKANSSVDERNVQPLSLDSKSEVLGETVHQNLQPADQSHIEVDHCDKTVSSKEFNDKSEHSILTTLEDINISNKSTQNINMNCTEKSSLAIIVMPFEEEGKIEKNSNGETCPGNAEDQVLQNGLNHNETNNLEMDSLPVITTKLTTHVVDDEQKTPVLTSCQNPHPVNKSQEKMNEELEIFNTSVQKEKTPKYCSDTDKNPISNTDNIENETFISKNTDELSLKCGEVSKVKTSANEQDILSCKSEEDFKSDITQFSVSKTKEEILSDNNKCCDKSPKFHENVAINQSNKSALTESLENDELSGKKESEAVDNDTDSTSDKSKEIYTHLLQDKPNNILVNPDYEPISPIKSEPVYEVVAAARDEKNSDRSSIDRTTAIMEHVEEDYKSGEFSKECIPPVRPTRLKKIEKLNVPEWTAPKQNIFDYLFSCFKFK